MDSDTPIETIQPSGENWTNEQDDCPLCNMEPRTDWFYEDETIVIANTISGHPFVILKRHQTECPDEILEHASEVVQSLFGDHEFRTRMNKVPDHFHTHVVEPTESEDHLVKE